MLMTKWSALLLIGLTAAPALSATAGSVVVPSPNVAGHLDAGGSKIFFESYGEGPPPGAGPVLVLIHDGLVHRETWDAQIAALAADHRVIRYDRRGYGRSELPTRPYSNVEDLKALLDHLAVERAGLVGSSSGGGLAVDFALAHPQRVAALVLVGAVVDGLGYSSHMARRGRGLNDPDIEKRVERLVADPYIVAPSNTATKELLRKLLRANPQNNDPAIGRNLWAYDAGRLARETALRRLHEIAVPTLVVTATEDVPDVHHHAGALQAGIAGARRVVIPDAGHLVYMERPEAFNRAVLSFLSLISLHLDGVPTFERGFVKVPGTHLYYEALGEGPPLVLLHASYLDHRMWDGQLEALSQSHRVIRFDQRGHGLTEGGTPRFANTQDVNGLLEHLGVEKAYLMGSTIGAAIAVRFALEYPDKVDGLILASPFLSGYDVTGSDWTEFIEKETAAWKRGDWAGVVEAALGIWLAGDEVAPKVRERLRTMGLESLQPGRYVGSGIPPDRPAAEQLAQIRVPTLVVVGQYDLTGVRAMADFMVDKIEGARKLEVPGVAQMANMEKPQELNRTVAEFLSRE